MKIVLVFPPFYLEPMYNLPPLGLLNLAAVLKESPHETLILDFPLAIRQGLVSLGPAVYDHCARRILEEAPDLVGFSVQCTTYPPAIQIARLLKRHDPSMKIVLGGHNASFVDRRTLTAFPFLDAVVRGEGEITFPELVDSYSQGRDGEGIPGVTYRSRESGEVVRNPDRDLLTSLDELPIADYRLVPPLSEYRDACNIRRSIAILEVGRGCPHRCAYCSQSLIWRRRTRTFSVERIIGEIRHLHREFGAECFLLAYDQFTARRSYVEEFCRRMMEEGLNRLPWYCISRLDGVDSTLLRTMRNAGCESMCYGIDSGSKRTLAFIHKDIDESILYQRVRETTDEGIVPTLSFVIGFPREEVEDLDATLVLALKSGGVGNTNPLIQMATILPGTELYEHYSHLLVREVDTYFSLGIEFDGGRRLEGDEDLIDSDPLLFSSFYNLPCPAGSLRDLNLLATYFPLMLNYFPRSFLLLVHELEESASHLFLHWMLRVQQRRGGNEPSLSPEDCFRYFGDYCRERLGQRERIRFAHLPDVIEYERTSMEAGKYESLPGEFSMDIHGIRLPGPQRDRRVLMKEFTFPMTDIIMDLKNGEVGSFYAPRETFLVFRKVEDRLDVKEINRFGRDLIAWCDGTNSPTEICERLYPVHGSSHSRDRFMVLCVDAIRTLEQMEILRHGSSE